MLVAAILGTTVVTVDSTVVNVALPAIADDLGGGLAGQQWTSNAYLLTLSSLLLVAGSLGDLFGARRVFALGVAGFGVTSIFCAVAPTVELLVVARALQGVFGALLTPAALAVIVATFPPDERGRAVGAWTAWGGIGTVLGPLIGGQLVDSASWRWIFAINVPDSADHAVPRPARGAGGPAARRGREGGRDRRHALRARARRHHVWPDRAAAARLGRPDGRGAADRRAWRCSRLRRRGRRAARIRCSRSALFRRRNFAVGNIETFSMYAGLGLLFFFLVLFLQQVAGYSALEAGTTTIPVTLVMFLLSTRFGALADRYGPRFFMGVGPLVAAVGLALLPAARRRRGLPDRPAARPADLLARARDDGRAAHGDGARRRGRAQRRHRVGREQRDRARGEPDRDRRGRRRGGVRRSARRCATSSAPRPGRPEVARAIEEAEKQPLARVVVTDVPPRVRAEVAAAPGTRRSRRSTWRSAIATALVALGGVLGLVGIVNPRRKVEAADCPGGQLAGCPGEAARGAAAPA